MPDSEATARGYHHGDLRNALIIAGRAILAEEGSAGLDLRKVARRAGVSHAPPYRHFPDKQALLVAIAEDGFQELYRQLAAAQSQAERAAIAQLGAIGRAYLAFALDRPAHMREMFSGLTLERQAHPSLYAASKQSFGLLTATIAAGQASGEIRAGDPTELAITIWSLIHGVTMLLLERQIAMDADAADVGGLIQGALQQLYNGLRPEQ
jgi:AcrR family transcriptional regulator